MPGTEPSRTLRIEEPGGRVSLLELPPRDLGLVQAAAGIVTAAPESDGRARALARFEEGGPQALQLALTILQGVLGGRLV